jgi:hypothetical protein
MMTWTNSEPTVSGNYYVYRLGQYGDPDPAHIDVEHDKIAWLGSEITETISEQPETVYYYGPVPVPPITDEMKAAAEELANRPETDVQKSIRMAQEAARARYQQ